MHLLVIRTSAMGDVALTAPVISAFRKHYPDVRITFLTRKSFVPFFNSIKNINFFCPDFQGRHHGFYGILKLFRDLNRMEKFDYIIDLHDVLRSRLICFLFSLKGISVFRIDKERNEKKKITKDKSRKQLKHSVDRYFDVFERAGFKIVPEKGPWIIPSPEALEKISGIPDGHAELNIGVAPYAKHKLKVWPEDYMVKLLSLIGEKHRSRFFLFGGAEELERLKAFEERVHDTVLVSGRMTLEEEIALMSRLSFIITMDSSNMHMAALAGTRVISIWGGTDPITGFGAWQQADNQALRIEYDVLTCRPCTVFGKGECFRGDFACMIWLTPEKVFEKLINLKII